MAVEPFHEIRTGGRYARRLPAVGDVVGRSVVLRDLGVSDENPQHGRRFEITCGRCQKPQLRFASHINAILRRGLSVACPDCVHENFLVHSIEYADVITERVLNGGPMYSVGETEMICKDVLAKLEEEFGPAQNPDDEFGPSDMMVAAGWPYSVNERNEAKRALEEYRAWQKECVAWREYLKMEARRVEEKKARDIRIALEQFIAREERAFSDRAGLAAAALAEFVRLGGKLEELEEP
jgi:hypothetical protein